MSKRLRPRLSNREAFLSYYNLDLPYRTWEQVVTYACLTSKWHPWNLCKRKMLGQIGFYKNTATLVNLRPLGKKSKIAEELQNCLHRATYADFVNWTQILRRVFLMNHESIKQTVINKYEILDQTTSNSNSINTSQRKNNRIKLYS